MTPAITAPGPSTWLLLSDKVGDNAQVRAIAAALPWACQEKRLAMRPEFVLGKPPVRASLAHLDRARSDPLEPPWPDLVLTIGRRPSSAALWVAEQSGGRTRLVIVGRPRRLLERFDLVLAPAHYNLPDRPNVMRLDYPPLRLDAAAVAAAASAWAPRLEAMRRPLLALLVGGRTGTHDVTPGFGAALARQAAAAAAAAGGSLYVSTSRRTTAAAVAAIAAALPAGTPLYRWTDAPAENPYLALLGQADRFIVTGDSLSMLVEVARLGKPLLIAPVPPAGGPLGRAAAALQRLGLAPAARDFDRLHRRLIEQGLAAWLGQPFPAGGRAAADELAAIAARIAALVAPVAATAPPVDLPGHAR
jgi:mitochondrial fission protein ELM1